MCLSRVCFRPKIFLGPKNILDLIFFQKPKKFFNLNFFGPKIFFGPKFFFQPNFFFGPQIFLELRFGLLAEFRGLGVQRANVTRRVRRTPPKLDVKFFRTKIFFFGPAIFFGHKLFWTSFFRNPNFLAPSIFSDKMIFQTQNFCPTQHLFWTTNFFLELKFCRTQKKFSDSTFF